MFLCSSVKRQVNMLVCLKTVLLSKNKLICYYVFKNCYSVLNIFCTFAASLFCMDKKATFGELVRFCIVGTTSAAIHYAIYWILQHWINVNVAYTIGYVLSFLANYYMTAHFTFKEKTSAKNGIGFGGAHFVNYCLHIVLFNFFLWLGLSRELAPLAVLAIAVPTNFFLVRFVFRKL